LQKAAGKVIALNLKVLKCKQDPAICVAKLALKDERDCKKYEEYFVKAMNEKAKATHKDCKLICAKPEAKQRFSEFIDYTRKSLLGPKLQPLDLEKERELFKNNLNELKTIYDNILSGIFKKGGNMALYDCVQLPPKQI